MNEEIKNKVREIQHKYCGESVETKLYWAIENKIKDEIGFLKYLIEYPELCKEKCKERIIELNTSENKPKES